MVAGGFSVVVMAALAVLVTSLAGPAISGGSAQQVPAGAPGTGQPGQESGHHTHGADLGHGDHEHAPIPAAYTELRMPPGGWTDAKAIARGGEIFAAKCALCHGEKGDGKGPAGVSLPLKPPDLTDAKMVAEMPGSYWLWRVSEGGLVEPFKSRASVMPAWKADLSMSDRWAVIAYAHTLSGHRGPHDASEHPELNPRPKFVSGEGTVIAVRRDKQQIVLEHGEIKGFMEPMTMGYKTEPGSLMNGVTPGDRVRFTIDTEARAITKINRLAP